MALNLKESFRLQKFFDGLMRDAQMSVINRDHALTTTKTHMRQAANSETTDKVEVVEVAEFYPNQDVLAFMEYLIEQKQALSCAIGVAKANCKFDIDAAIETNKYRQTFRGTVSNMLKYTASKRIENGRDYKFNAEGNQTQYTYEVEVVTSEAYDREAAKSAMKTIIAKADEVSREIDEAMINTEVDYVTPFDVNDTFEDVMNTFLNAKTVVA